MLISFLWKAAAPLSKQVIGNTGGNSVSLYGDLGKQARWQLLSDPRKQLSEDETSTRLNSLLSSLLGAVTVQPNV